VGILKGVMIALQFVNQARSGQIVSETTKDAGPDT